MARPEVAQSPTQGPAPPMGELLALLRSSGFLATTDDYVDLLKIIEHFGHEDLDSLALRICPIIAITPEEQERFYKVFEGYKRAQELQALPPGKKSRRWLWLLIAIGVIIIIAAAFIWWLRSTSHFPLGFSAYPQDTVAVRAGHVFEEDFSQIGMFAGRREDTAKVTFTWYDIGRDTIGRGLRVQHRFSEPGLHLVRRSIASSTLEIDKADDTLPVYVCSLPATKILGKSDEQILPVKTTISFKAETPGSPVPFTSYRWQVDGGTPVIADIETKSGLTHTFDSAGIYTISCRPIVAGAEAMCVDAATVEMVIADTGKQYIASFTGNGITPITKAKLRNWPAVLALMVGAAVGLWGFWRRKPKAQADQAVSPQSPPPSGSTRGPPYEVPFAPVKPEDVIIDKPLRRFLHQLRYKAEEEITILDIKGSIHAAVRKAGFTEAVLTPRKRVQEYLVFIDKSKPHGMLHALYNHFTDVMEEEGIPLSRFYYDADFLCRSKEYPSGTSLRSVADNYASSIPIIFGDGKALLHAVAPVIKPEVLQQLLRWEQRILITPIPQGAWGQDEQVLQAYVSMSSADAEDLERLGQSLRSGASNRISRQDSLIKSLPEDEQETVSALRVYLGGDETLFQWLCALCIYPKLRWELIVAIGRAVLKHHGREHDLRFDILLRLCRIPWMAEGSIPQRLRLELLKNLSVADEVAARAALVDEFASVDRSYPGDYIFSAEQNLQSLMSRFVLYANDATRFAEHAPAAEEIKKRLLEKTITDVPALKYLDKPEGSKWSTPLREGESLSNYLDAQGNTSGKAERKKTNTRAIIAAGILVLIASVWIALNSGAGISQPLFSGLYSVDSSQPVKLSYSVAKSFFQCGDSSTQFRELQGTFYAGTEAYPVSYDARSLKVEVDVPYRALTRPGTIYRMTLGSEGAKPATFSLQNLSSGGNILASCSQYRPGDTALRLSSQTGIGAALPEVLNEIWIGEKNNRLVSINLDRNFIYYSTGGARTWGTYRIDTVYKIGETYKVLADAAPGYNVFFIRDIQNTGFSLTMCPERYKQLREALNARDDCGITDVMTPYYQNDQDKIFLPVAPKNGGMKMPIRAEWNKLAKALNTLRNSKPKSYNLYYDLYRNRNFLRSYNAYNPAILFEDMNAPYIDRVYTNRRIDKRTVNNPFQREYLVLQLIRKQDNGYTAPRILGVPPAEVIPQPSTVSEMTDLRRALSAGDMDRAAKLYSYLRSNRDKNVGAEATYYYIEYIIRKGESNETANALKQIPSGELPDGYWKDKVDMLRIGYLISQGDYSRATKGLQDIIEKTRYPPIRNEANKKLKEISGEGATAD